MNGGITTASDRRWAAPGEQTTKKHGCVVPRAAATLHPQVFIVSNLSPGIKKGSALAKINLERAFMRFEFLEVSV